MGPLNQGPTVIDRRPEPGTIGQPPAAYQVTRPTRRRSQGRPNGAAIPPTSLAPSVRGGTASSFGR